MTRSEGDHCYVQCRDSTSTHVLYILIVFLSVESEYRATNLTLAPTQASVTGSTPPFLVT